MTREPNKRGQTPELPIMPQFGMLQQIALGYAAFSAITRSAHLAGR
jgi:hypothetical protein